MACDTRVSVAQQHEAQHGCAHTAVLRLQGLWRCHVFVVRQWCVEGVAVWCVSWW
jgi:hypothetical protein